MCLEGLAKDDRWYPRAASGVEVAQQGVMKCPNRLSQRLSGVSNRDPGRQAGIRAAFSNRALTARLKSRSKILCEESLYK